MQLRKASKRLLGAVVMLLLPLHAAAQTTSDGEPLEEQIQEYDPEILFEDGANEPDWIPSLRFGLGINHQGVDSSVDTLRFTDRFGVTEYIGTDGTVYDNGIYRGGADSMRTLFGRTPGTNPIDGPSIQFGFEIMGPEIEALLWKPRPFFTFEYRNQLEGSTTTARAQSGPPRIDGIDRSPRAHRVRVKGDAEQLDWFLAGLGTAFQLPIEGYNVKLKPSLNYFYSRSQIEAILFQLVRTSPTDFPPNFPQTTLQEVDNHGIAPRLELDAEIFREGPLAFGFFVALDFLYILGGPVKHVTDVNGCFGDAERSPNDPLGAPCSRVNDPNNAAFYKTSGTLRYELERDRLTYQGTAGIRVSWMGGP